MSKIVTISGTNYILDQQGDSSPWGENLSDLLQALIDVANNTTGTGDILNTSFTVANNVSSPTNITGANFDVATIRSAIISYSLNRSTNLSEVSECGQIYVTYNSSGSSWELAQNNVGNAGVTFSMTSAGQLQFTSTNLAGTGYSGLLRFKAVAFAQT